MTPIDEQLRTLLERAAPSSAGVDFSAVADQGRRFQRRRRLVITASIAIVALVAGSLTAVVATSHKSGEATVSPKPSSGNNVTYQLTPADGVASDVSLQSDADTLTRRLHAAGIDGKAQVGSGGIALQVPTSAASNVAYLTGTGRLGLRIPSVEKATGLVYPQRAGACWVAGSASGSPPPCITARVDSGNCPQVGSAEAQAVATAPATDWIVACDRAGFGTVAYALSPERLSGNAVSGAKATIQSGVNGTSTGQWIVELNFTSAGQRAWSDLTDAIAGSPGCPASSGGPTTASPPAYCQLAVVVDGVVLSAPVIQERIAGSAEIAGDFTEQAAKSLAAALSNGTLPVPLTVAQPLDKQYSANGGTFRYPSSWRLATFNEVGSFTSLIADVSNYPIDDPCTHPDGNLACDPSNMARLGTGGVLIEWSTYGFPNYGIDNAPGKPTTIDGRPARIQIEAARSGSSCAVIGAVEEVDVAIAPRSLHGADTLWRMTGCMVDPGSLGTVLAVAHSLHLSLPAPS